MATSASVISLETIHDRNGLTPRWTHRTRRPKDQLGHPFESYREYRRAYSLRVLGVYSAMSYTMRRRTRELAIRKALGATRGEIYRLALVRGLGMLLLGIVPGVLLAMGAVTGLRSAIDGLQTYDSITLLVVPVGFIGIGVVACWAAARKTANVDPNVALRNL